MGSRKNSRIEFLALFTFLFVAVLVLTNGFSGRIFAEEEDLYTEIEPIGEVLSEILRNYVYEPDLEKTVEGALKGIMSSLDRNSSYIPAEGFKAMREETEGSFDGIGIYIGYDDDNNIVCTQPIPNGPAAKAGMLAGDRIFKIDGVETKGMETDEAARRIKGPSGQKVKLTVMRTVAEAEEPELIELEIKRGKIPLESIEESRILDGGIAYLRLHDFKKNSADDLRKDIEAFKKEGTINGMILDLRWNPGGLLTASREVCELFLPKNTLVTYTRGREMAEGRFTEDMRLYTERQPVLPEDTPLVVLVGYLTASSSEIVTGALQFHQRAIVVGEKTFGKGSVQTIIPLSKPQGSALRLTTALYYTPADVTINEVGILPDVAVPMEEEAQLNLRRQMYASVGNDLSGKNEQNHGTVTGNEVDEKTIEDAVLQKALEILGEGLSKDQLIQKYHKDVHETQVAAVEAAAEAAAKQ